MSFFTYAAFSRALNVVRFSDIKGREKDYGINYDTTNFRKDILLFPNMPFDENHIVLVDKKEATFNNCFKNSFIYEYHVSVSRTPAHDRCITRSDLDEETKAKELEKLANSEWSLYKQVQYDFLLQHLNIGEFVEIYEEMTDHINFNLGPPESECIIGLDEFLNLPMPKKTIDKHKITICRYLQDRGMCSYGGL